ncbi:ribonuclease H-like domain-containing protein [Tanacetum coccineum]
MQVTIRNNFTIVKYAPQKGGIVVWVGGMVVSVVVRVDSVVSAVVEGSTDGGGIVVRWNKPDLDIMSFDDLYNNFKIVEQEVKGTASSSLSSQNLAFMSSTSSTNKVNTAYGVNTANIQVSTASTQKTGRKITINGSDTVGYDKSKVKCFNCHKLRHFARECRGPMNQDNKSKNQDSSRRTIIVEEISSKAMLAIDGAGFDRSFMADEEVPTNMTLMAFSDFKVHNNKTCSKTCLKSFESLKTQLDDLRIEFNKSEFNLATYKRGLASIEEQLVFYKKNEVLFCEQLTVLKRDISYKDLEISVLKSELENLKQEKESNQLNIEKFDKASKSLDKVIGSQIPDKSRKGLGFSVFKGYGPKTSMSVSEDTSNEVRKSPDSSLIEELVSTNQLEKKTVFHTVAKINFACCNYHQRERMASGNNYTRVNYNYSAKKAHPRAHRNIVPRVGFAAALAVLVTGASQSRQHESHHRFFPVDTSLIHIESRKSPTKSLFDVGSRRISIFTVNTKEYHSDVLAIITRIMRRT